MVLNLIITGIPSIPNRELKEEFREEVVLNLIITGIPSIRNVRLIFKEIYGSFKPYYNWNTFNTDSKLSSMEMEILSFKPYYNWNTFNT